MKGGTFDRSDASVTTQVKTDVKAKPPRPPGLTLSSGDFNSTFAAPHDGGGRGEGDGEIIWRTDVTVLTNIYQNLFL